MIIVYAFVTLVLVLSLIDSITQRKRLAEQEYEYKMLLKKIKKKYGIKHSHVWNMQNSLRKKIKREKLKNNK